MRADMALMLILALPTAVVAQETTPGQVATSSVGQAGARQARGQGAAGIEPMARISNRIQNRVQSRLRNRIDRSYDPQSNTTSPFEAASRDANGTGD